MARTVTHTPQTVTIENTKAGTTVADIKYTPTLSTTLVGGTPITYGEGERDNATTTTATYVHIIYDDLITKYA